MGSYLLGSRVNGVVELLTGGMLLGGNEVVWRRLGERMGLLVCPL